MIWRNTWDINWQLAISILHWQQDAILSVPIPRFPHLALMIKRKYQNSFLSRPKEEGLAPRGPSYSMTKLKSVIVSGNYIWVLHWKPILNLTEESNPYETPIQSCHSIHLRKIDSDK